MWEPHAGYGDLSRDLILVMPPIYREAFPHFRDVEGQLQTDFFRHIAGIVYSCLIDVNEGNWFRDFLTGLSDDQKAHWARQMEMGLRGAPEARRVQVWQRWMKHYWEDRLRGKCFWPNMLKHMHCFMSDSPVLACRESSFCGNYDSFTLMFEASGIATNHEAIPTFGQSA